MKKRLVMAAALSAVLGVALIASPGRFGSEARAAGGCNASSVQGPYGFTGQGFTTNGNAQAAQAMVGLLYLSPTVAGGPAGTLVGSATLSSRGVITRSSITGRYTIPNCYVGSVVLTISTATLHYDLVWAQQSNSSTGIAQVVFLIQTDSRTAMTLTLERT